MGKLQINKFKIGFLFFFLSINFENIKTYSQETKPPNEEKIINCQKEINSLIKSFTPEFLAYQAQLTKYRLAYAGNLFSLGRSNQSRNVIESYLDHLEKDINILKSTDSKYEEQLNHLKSLRPGFLSNDKLANFIEMVSVLMENPNSRLFQETLASTDLSPAELTAQWKSYGLKKTDATTANLLKDLQVNDPNTDAARLSLSEEYARDFRKRKQLVHQDLRYFTQLQNKIWQGKDRKGAGLSYSTHQGLDFNGDKKISFDEVDKHFKHQFENLIKQSQYCDPETLSNECFSSIIDKPSLLNEDVIKILEIKADDYNFKNGKITSKGGDVGIKKDFHRWKGISARCFKSFEDDQLPTIDFKNLPQTEEYYLVYKEDGFNKEEIKKDFTGKGSQFRKTKKDESGKYLDELGYKYLHITNDLILGGDTRIYTDFGKTEEDSRKTIFNNGELNIPAEKAKNFALISRYGNKPVFFDECGEKINNPSIKNPLSSMHDYYDNIESMHENLKKVESALELNNINLELANDYLTTQPSESLELAKIYQENLDLAQKYSDWAEADQQAADQAYFEYNQGLTTVEGRELIHASDEKEIDETNFQSLKDQNKNFKTEISQSEQYSQEIKAKSEAAVKQRSNPNYPVMTRFKESGSSNSHNTFKRQNPDKSGLTILDKNSHPIEVGMIGPQPVMKLDKKINISPSTNYGDFGFAQQASIRDSSAGYNIFTSSQKDLVIRDSHGVLHNMKEVRLTQAAINKISSNQGRIHAYYSSKLYESSTCKTNNYGILNKETGRLIVYKIPSGEEVENIPVLTGFNKGDKLLTWKYAKDSLTNESTTPAGSFIVGANRGDQDGYKGKYKNYNNNLLPLRDDRGDEGIAALHQAPINASERYKALKNGGESRKTNGCINATEQGFESAEKLLVGCKLHVLPDEEGGRFKVSDGMLKFYYTTNKSSEDLKKYNITPSKVGKGQAPIHIGSARGNLNRLEKEVALTLMNEKGTLMGLYAKEPDVNMTDELYNQLAHLTMATMLLECEAGVGHKYRAKKYLNQTYRGQLILRGVKTAWRMDGWQVFFEDLSKGCGQNKKVPKIIKDNYPIDAVNYNHRDSALITFAHLADNLSWLNSIIDKWDKDCPLHNYEPKVDFLRFLYRGASDPLIKCQIDLTNSKTLRAVTSRKDHYEIYSNLEGNLETRNLGRGQLEDTRLGLYDRQGRQVLPHHFTRFKRVLTRDVEDIVYDAFMESGLCQRIKSELQGDGTYVNTVLGVV